MGIGGLFTSETEHGIAWEPDLEGDLRKLKQFIRVDLSAQARTKW